MVHLLGSSGPVHSLHEISHFLTQVPSLFVPGFLISKSSELAHSVHFEGSCPSVHCFSAQEESHLVTHDPSPSVPGFLISKFVESAHWVHFEAELLSVHIPMAHSGSQFLVQVPAVLEKVQLVVSWHSVHWVASDPEHSLQLESQGEQVLVAMSGNLPLEHSQVDPLRDRELPLADQSLQVRH